jgi:acyl-CoA thioester hydrolase
MKTVLSIRVVAFETDYAGVVSNTRYLEYLERGRYALLHAAGLEVARVLETHNVQAVVRRIEIDFLRPARHEDELELEVAVHAHRGATTTLHSELRRVADGVVMMRATQTLAYTDANLRAVRVPAVFRDALSVEPTPIETSPL